VGTLCVAARGSAQSAPIEAAPVAAAPAPPSRAEFPPEPSGSFAAPRRRRHGEYDLRPILVNVQINGRSFIVFNGEQRPIADCTEACQFWAWPGSYRVRLTADAAHLERSVRLRLRNPGSYLLELGDDDERNIGLALGITGSTAVFIGALMTFAGLLEEICAGDDSGESGSCKTPPVVYYGLATMAGGTLLAVPGFVMFGSNITRFHYDAVPMPISARVGPVPMPHGGLGLGATISF
jgi:hypothetical protein